MTQSDPAAIFDWFSDQFRPGRRSDFVDRVGPHLTPLVSAGQRALDLGCGAGPFAFLLESCGARVTGIDLTPALIGEARAEATRRGSRVEFVVGDVLDHDLGSEAFDLIVCLGNVLLDIPPAALPRFRDRVFRALKPGGRFALQYHDGVARIARVSDPPAVVEEGAEGPIRRTFREYDPDLGAYRATYRHLVRGESREYTGYVYTAPLIRIVLGERLALQESVRSEPSGFLDIYARPPSPAPGPRGALTRRRLRRQPDSEGT